ncbi:nickel ABC transporter, nickel/metallophore periplasmic binding protein [Bacillus sp. SD075]|uniref:nickel ABC transporter substrate-binding protein n=1 Tax=Bacillus sp. SD075 TaxID=2781732 RepID=UPI001A96F606|nr:nickel ABC transporter substrate-binding protein [Bacillus sp. SD075]MBO0997515.1 nickel ABC transporter, nickel/metallophore periplasmic binding protein [Bacillus sp. SD075]
MKKITAYSLILTILTLFLLSACSSKNEKVDTASNDVSNDELVFASTKDIRDINPHLYTGEMPAQNMVFESLVINTDGGIKPALAESWDISENGLIYTFHLKEGVTFTDGEPFNAEAVKKNIDAVLKNIEKNSWLNLVAEIKETKAIDEHTFQLTLKNAYYPTLEELGLTRPFRFISPKSFIDGTTANGVNGYAGTGPYVLKEHKENQYAIFTENEDYWGDKPKIKSIKWKVMPDHQTILLALEKGEIDLLFGSDGDMIDSDSFKILTEQGKYKTVVSHPVGSRAIVLNSKKPIVNDPKVREAFQKAINKQVIADGILNGAEHVADTLLSPTVPYADVDLKAQKYSKDKANKLLTEAGWEIGKDGYRYKDGKMLEVTIYYNSDNAQERTISQSMQNDLKQVGVSLKIVGEEKQAYFDRQKTGDFDLMYSLSWGLPYDPQTYVSSWRVPSHADYQAQLGLKKKKWLDHTISDIMIEQKEDNRKKMYKEILTYIHDENVYIPLTYSVTKAVHAKGLKGVGFNVSQYEIPFEKMHFSK